MHIWQVGVWLSYLLTLLYLLGGGMGAYIVLHVAIVHNSDGTAICNTPKRLFVVVLLVFSIVVGYSIC